MPGPLDGFRVVDCSRGTAGPRATGFLADYGADVVWVEPPGGDPWRDELAVPYSVFNRGKRSVTLDLTADRDKALLVELVSGADVFVESWRPGVADDLGLGFDVLLGRNPGLVYCSISGFGQNGPWRDVPGYEALVHALVGTMTEQPGHRPGPIFQGLPFASIGAALLADIGILAALHRHSDDGRGRYVETSLLDGALAYLSMTWSTSDSGSTKELQAGEARTMAHTRRLITRSFRCADDEYVAVHTGAVGAFDRLMAVLGLEDRIPPSGSGHDMGTTLAPDQTEILEHEVPEIFLTEPRDVWLDRLLSADICAIPHLRAGAAFDEPQPRHNRMVVRVDDPAVGPVDQVAPAATFSATPGAVRAGAPAPGQHTQEVLAEVGQPGLRVARAPTCDGPSAQPLLAGVKILDIGAYYAGPYASRLLADLGADVIKLEPIAGDPMRGIAGVFRSAQAGKRSIALDLKDPDGQRIARELVRWADAVHHNMRPGAAERLGLGYEQLRELDPDVVYAHAPGWGSSGPDAGRQSFAPMMGAYVGIGYEAGGQFNPPLFSVGNEDPGNGLLGAAAILMALLHKQRTGRGQLVEHVQLNATMMHMAHVVRRPDGAVLGAERLDPLQLGVGALERLYQTADGWLCLVARRDEDVRRLGPVIGIDLLGDARFATRSARDEHEYELGQLIGGILSTRTTKEWLVALGDAGVPVADPVPHGQAAFLSDPENERAGRIASYRDPGGAHVREVSRLLRLSDAVAPPHRPAPALGEHTAEILRSLGALSDRQEPQDRPPG